MTQLIKLSRPGSWLFWLSWHLIAVALLAVLSSQYQFGPIWRLDAGDLAICTGLAVTYLLIAVTLTWRTWRNKDIRRLDCAFILSIAIIGFQLYLQSRDRSHSLRFLLLSLALLGSLAILSLILKGRLQKPALAMSALILAATLWLGYQTPLYPRTVDSATIGTTLVTLAKTTYRNYIAPESIYYGGGLALFKDGYLLAKGDGELYFFRRPKQSHTLESRKLSSRIPLNLEEFKTALKQRKFPFTQGNFRVGGVLIEERGDKFRYYASHHFWHGDKNCYTVRVSYIESDSAALLAQKEPLAWQTLYESQPCLTLDKHKDFPGYASGGRMALLDSRRLLLTVGDHEFNGVNAPEMFAQDDGVPYGKTILIDLDSKNSRTFSKGHRNAQGLHVAADGSIWSTEHAAKGGDELNLVSEGLNYGWPLVTYGSNYESHVWPLNAKQGFHDGYEPPVYAWMPSIGISNVISVQGALLKLWQDDLLVSSLRDQSIMRMRIAGRRVLFVERIQVNELIRDLVEDRDGRLVIWTDRNSVMFLEPVHQADRKSIQKLSRKAQSEMLFAGCRSCHAVTDGKSHGIGPDLKGVLQRGVAQANAYPYSDALKSLAGNWSDKRLDEFLANPRAMAPGTSMQFEGIADPTDRAMIIEYLKSIN